MKDKCNWQGIGTIVVITMCLVSILCPAMTQSSISMLSNATDGETEEILKSTLVLSPTPSLTPPLEEQNPSPTSAHNQTQTHVPTPSLIPDHTPVLSHTPPPQEKNTSLLNASNQTQTPTPSPTPGQDNTSTSTPAPSPTPGPDSALTPIPSPTPSPTPSHAAPTITLFAPSSPVHDTDGEPRTFNLSIDQPVNVSWLLNGTEVFNQSNVTESIYMNTSSKTGTWNVSAVATRANGTAMQTWIWNVSSQVTPTPTPGPTPSPSPMTNPVSTPSPTPAPLKSPSSNVKPSTPFYIYGWVHYEDDAECSNPIVNIINLNASNSWQAETSAESNFFQLLANNISEGDVLEFNASDGTEYTTATHEINQIEVTNSGLFDFNLNLALSGSALTVNVDLTPDDDPSTPGIQIINPDQSSKNKAVTIIANVTDLNGYENITSVIANITGPSIVAASPVSLELVSNTNATTATYNANFKLANHLEGEYKVEIMATNAEGLTGTGSVIFSYSQGPDLIVMGISTPSYLVANASNTIDAIIANAGTVRATEFNISLTSNGILIATVTVPSLNACENKTVNFRWTPDREENYVLTVTADSDTKITESNETNNNHSKTLSVGAPDFTVTNLSLHPPAPLLGDVVTINADISNLGREDGTTFVEVYWDEALIENKTISLNALELTIVNTSWNATIAGVHNISVRVDQHNTVVESNETNNNQTRQIFVNGTDLAVTEIVLSPEYPLYRGLEVNVTATVANLGAIDASNFTVTFRDGLGRGNTSGGVLNTTNVTSLAAGNSTNITVLWNITVVDDHTITVSIPFDPNTDNNEMNNMNSKNTSVPVMPEWDFSVENVSAYPGEVNKGTSVTITATIGNRGYASENVNVSFYVNSTDYVGSGGERFIEIGRTEKPVYVEYGKTNTTSITWNVNITGGDHLIVAVADPDDEFDEGDDTFIPLDTDSIILKGNVSGNNVNNCILHVITPELAITNLTSAPENPVVGDRVDVTAVVVNKGNEAANSTVWFFMEKNLDISDTVGFSTVEVTNTWTVSQPEEILMRIHFKSIDIDYNEEYRRAGEVNAFVKDNKGQRRPVYFYVNEMGQAVKVPKIDFETSGCCKCWVYNTTINEWELILCSADVDRKRWEDVWTNWTYGSTLEINAIVPSDAGGIVLSIDKYQVRLGNRTVTLDVGESKSCDVTWNTNLPRKLRTQKFKYNTLIDEKEKTLVGENYTLIANVESVLNKNETYLSGTDLTVTNVSVELGVWNNSLNRTEVWDGDFVRINATIKNMGRMNAMNFNVNFTEVYAPKKEEAGWTIFDHFALINTTHIEGLEAGNTTNISVLWNASIREIGCQAKHKNKWKYWNETADDYTINIEINPLENQDYEEHEDNNSKAEKIHVNRSRDFIVKNLSFAIINETCNSSDLTLHDLVTVNASLNITNLANQGGIVNVSFYVGEEHEIGNDSVAFAVGNGTGYAAIKWKIEDFVGDHNITVVVDPMNEIEEINETNNESTWQIHIKASDLVVENLEFYPENPKKGETVNINVTIANRGEVNASNVTLSIYDWADGHIEDVDAYSELGHEGINIKRENAIAMCLYLDLEIDEGEVCILDSKGNQEKCYYTKFHGWTPWTKDNNISVVTKRNGTSSVYAKVSKVYYLKLSEQNFPSTNTTIQYNLAINETKTITVNWTASRGGERFIAVIVDPEHTISEHNESNNMQSRYMSVQTADITVSNLSLAWSNGTRISEEDTVKHNDTVKLSAKVTNIGTETANNFNVRFLVNDIQIRGAEGTKLSLAPNMTTEMFVFWNATVGHNVIKAEVDYENTVDETNETNNLMVEERYVCGAEVSGNASWESLGLNGTILFDPSQPYEEDEVNVSVNVTNTGCVNAADFGVVLFFDYEPDIEHLKRGHVKPKWLNKSYEGAISTYLKIDIQDYQILAIYDGNGNEVKRVDQSCWVHVMGDTASISYCIQELVWSSNYTITYYPIYAENLSRIQRLDINTSINIPLERNVTVSVGNYTVTAFIDPENRVPEDNKGDNIVYDVMQVLPAKDFTVIDVTVENTNLSDMDTRGITAMVANVGYTNGTTDVRFVDYENETRTYKYHFDKIFPQSYLPIQPIAATLSTPENVPYEDLVIIHRPDVDGILLHLNKITINQPRGGMGEYKLRGSISVCDENVNSVWNWLYNGDYESAQTLPNQTIYVPGETAYIYKYNAQFVFDGYTTETRVHEENVTLNASQYGPPKFITAPHWIASTGNHTISVSIDTENRTAEINESNNTVNHTLSVNASRDAIIEDIVFNPQYPENGENVTITAIVKNNGTKEANFTVDLWMNATRNSTLAYVPNASWVTGHKDENRTSYIILLNHTKVSLAPGNSSEVNATWYNISILGDATHEVTVIADPLDEIDERNESDNELRREIVMLYADFTVAGFISASRGDKNASVSIENMGKKNETNVTVRFDVSKYSEIEETGSKTSWKSVTEKGAENIRVHFEWLDARDGWLEIRKNLTDEVPVVRYRGDVFKNEWSPWVNGDMIWLVYSLKKQRSFSVDAYEWGELEDKIIDCINGSESKTVTIPSQWTNKYDEPQKLTVTIDPSNEKNELVKANNSRTGLMYIDLVADNLTFVSPKETMLCVLVEQNRIRATIKNTNETDGIVFPAGGEKHNFDVALEVIDLNGTVVYRHTGNSNAKSSTVDFEFQYADRTLYAGEEINVTFNIIGDRIYPEFVGDTKDYKVSVIVDSGNDINEANDFHPRGEGNNETSDTGTVYHESGYTGGDLDTVSQGKIYGDMIYSIGTSSYNDGGVTFGDISSQIPGNATIKVAKLYLHWFYWEKHVSSSVDVQFNGEPVSTDREYSDDTIATSFKTRWGTYVYDVTAEVRDIVAHGGNYVASAQIYENATHITGMGLLIVYEDEDKPLIEYGIAEGTWTMMADNEDHPSGLLPEQCTANATFAGVVNISKGKAELLTVLASWRVEKLRSGTTGDALLFNGREVGMLRGASYWAYEGDRCMALTTNRWEDVTDYLSTTENKAEIQSRGNFMMATNAFFKVRYLPDLTVTLNAPSSVKGGATRRIEATIRNLGESKAENFVVEFTATDGTPSNEVRTVKLLEGNNETTIDFTWTAPDKVGALDLIKIQDVTISVKVDSGGNVEEFDESNNIGSKDISVTMTEKPLLLRGGGGGGGSGNGTGFGKGAVAEASTTSGVSGEAAKTTETKGKTITGRLMKGIVAQSEAEGEEGGERGEFSWVKLLIRLALLAVAVALVYVGYCYERRRHKYKNNEK